MFPLPLLMQGSAGEAGVDYGALIEAMAAGTKGFVVDPSDPSTLFTNTIATTNVVTSGVDMAAVIRSKWGSTVHSFTGASPRSPLWLGNSLQYDGTDDYSITTGVALARNVQGIHLIGRNKVTSEGANGRAYFAASTSTGTSIRFALKYLPGGAIGLYVRRLNGDAQNSFTSGAGAYDLGVEHTIEAFVDYGGTGAVGVYIDDDLVISGTLAGTPGNTSDTDSSRCRIGITVSNTLNDYYHGLLGRMVYMPRRLTSEEISNCRAWVSDLAL